ncbi:hypothetical protein WMF31_38640 [Sorangium sp. So ce1036]
MPSRSHGKRTRTRPYSSVKIARPGGPVTTAHCTPGITGRGVTRGG